MAQRLFALFLAALIGMGPVVPAQAAAQVQNGATATIDIQNAFLFGGGAEEEGTGLPRTGAAGLIPLGLSGLALLAVGGLCVTIGRRRQNRR